MFFVNLQLRVLDHNYYIGHVLSFQDFLLKKWHQKCRIYGYMPLMDFKIDKQHVDMSNNFQTSY